MLELTNDDLKKFLSCNKYLFSYNYFDKLWQLKVAKEFGKNIINCFSGNNWKNYYGTEKIFNIK